MKLFPKMICALAAFALLSAPLRSQERFAQPGQWSMDFGIAPIAYAGEHAITEAALNPFAQIFAVILTFGLYKPEKNYDEYHTSPALSLRTNYQINSWLVVCADVNGGWARCDRIKEENGPVERTDHWQSLSVVPGVRFTYVNKPKWQLFSGASVGAAFLFSDKEDEGGVTPTFEIVPVGVNYGGPVYGHLELNWGTEFGATLRAGVGLKF